ncbi:MAG: hypothetical protein R3E53_21870 [Myxococcota bacterium]
MVWILWRSSAPLPAVYSLMDAAVIETARLGVATCCWFVPGVWVVLALFAVFAAVGFAQRPATSTRNACA